MGDKAHTGFTLASLLSKPVHITKGYRDTSSHTGQRHTFLWRHTARRQAWDNTPTSLVASGQTLQRQPAATTLLAHTVNRQTLSPWRSEGISVWERGEARQTFQTGVISLLVTHQQAKASIPVPMTSCWGEFSHLNFSADQDI